MASNKRHQALIAAVHRIVAENYPNVTPLETVAGDSLSIKLAGKPNPSHDALIYVSGSLGLGAPRRVGRSNVIQATDGNLFVVWMDEGDS